MKLFSRAAWASHLIILLGVTPLTTRAHAENYVNACETCALMTVGPSVPLPDIKSIAANSANLMSECPPAEQVYKQSALSAFEVAFPGVQSGKEPVIQGNVGGLELTDTPEILELTEKLLGAKPTEVWKRVRGCQTARCALATVYGTPEAALRALTIAKTNGYFMTLSQENNPKPEEETLWSTEEIRIIQKTLKKVPAQFRKIKHLGDFVRLPDSVTLGPSGKSIAEAWPPGAGAFGRKGHIRFTKKTFTDPTWVSNFIIHEMAHEYDFSTQRETGKYAHRDPAFWKLSQWDENEPTEERDRTGRVVALSQNFSYEPSAQKMRDYSMTDPFEDFADSIGYTITFPEEAARNAPDKFKYVVNQFLDGKYPRDNSWPELNRIVQPHKENGELVTSCLKGLMTVCDAPEQKTAFFYTKNSDNSFSGAEMNAILYQGNCLSQFTKSIEPQLLDELGRCEHLLDKPLVQYLAAEANPLLGNTLLFLKHMTKEIRTSAVPGCYANSPRIKFCVQEAVEALKKTQSSEMAQISPKGWEYISDEIVRLLTGPEQRICRQ